MIIKKKSILTILILFYFLLTNIGAVFAAPTVYPKGTTIYHPNQTTEGYTLFYNCSYHTPTWAKLSINNTHRVPNERRSTFFSP